MVDAVAARTAPSPYELQQATPSSGSVTSEGRSAPAAAMMPVPPKPNDAVILDLSEQARAVLAQTNPDVRASDAQAEELAGLIRFEERFRLMTEFTALQQELAFISDKTAAYALDQVFQTPAAQGESGQDTGARAEIDRYLQRRDELMPRFAELTRKLRALPGQES